MDFRALGHLYYMASMGRRSATRAGGAARRRARRPALARSSACGARWIHCAAVRRTVRSMPRRAAAWRTAPFLRREGIRLALVNCRLARIASPLPRTVVVEQTLDQVHMREHHAPAAVPVQLELGERLTLGAALDEQREVRVPLVADHLATRKAAHRDDLRVSAPGACASATHHHAPPRLDEARRRRRAGKKTVPAGK